MTNITLTQEDGQITVVQHDLPNEDIDDYPEDAKNPILDDCSEVEDDED